MSLVHPREGKQKKGREAGVELERVRCRKGLMPEGYITGDYEEWKSSSFLLA